MTDAAIAAAIHESLIAFPVYRIYGSKGPLEARDADVLSGVISSAAEKLADRRAIDVLWQGHPKAGYGRQRRKEFRRRFQQLSGPVMAKAMEDTRFYRYNRLLAVNEVGGDPDIKPGGVEAFHALMLKRAKLNPHGLSATSTHDTKRGRGCACKVRIPSKRRSRCLGARRWSAGAR